MEANLKILKVFLLGSQGALIWLDRARDYLKKRIGGLEKQIKDLEKGCPT